MNTCHGCAFLEEYITSNSRVAWRCTLWELWEIDWDTQEACEFYEADEEAPARPEARREGGTR